jgi:hypothetical protein
MATEPQQESLNIDEQLARIEKTLVDIAKSRAETLKLVTEVQILPRVATYQAMLATAALIGAGAAIAKLFFP